MWIALLQFISAGVGIIVGGIGLARSADLISRRSGMGHLIGGALLISTATSLPDLFVGISAARNGLPNLIVGDLVGAALINLMILAVLDMTNYSRGRLLSRVAAAHALSGAMSVTLLALTGMAVLLPDELNPSIAGVSVGLWAVAAAYLLGLRLIVFDQQIAGEALQTTESDEPHGRLFKPILVYLASAALIIVMAPMLTHSADQLAEMTGLGNTFFGTAFLPLCTTLPEFVVGITAIRMKAFPLVVSNAFGSIAFNLFLLVPIDLMYSESLLASASQTHAITCLAAILITAIAVMGQLYQSETRTHFLEPDALLILVLTFGAFAILYYLR